MPNAMGMKQSVNLQTGYSKGQHCCTFTSACGWCATSYSILGNRGGIKGDLCAGKERPGVNAATGGKMRKKDLQLLPITWLRASHTGKSCVDWAKHLRPLSNLILKGSRKTILKCGSEFYTSCSFSEKIYVVLDKGMWKKSVIALEAPTGLNGPCKSYLGSPCPWSRAPFESLFSVPALVMLQQCWSPWPWGKPMS